MQIINCAQNSEEWLRARMGIPTASQFATVLAKGKDGGTSITRRTYMLKLAGEIITGTPMENYSNEYMERGHDMEDEARDLYAFQTSAQLERVGFIRNGRAGCSPDSLVGADGGLEIKTKAPHLLIELMLKNEFPPEHKAQVQGTLWLTNRQWWDLRVYYRGMPPFTIRAERDEPYIKRIESEVDRFNAELDQIVEQIRQRGEALAA